MQPSTSNSKIKKLIDIMEIFAKLPLDVVNKIINYTDVIVFRHGKYLNRINKEKDNRYKLLACILRPTNMQMASHTIEKFILKLINYKKRKPKGYMLIYSISKNYIHISIEYVEVYEDEEYGDCFRIKSNAKYIFTK
jgi:hypothetical protein